jgi:hypothetical protein
MRDTVPWTEKQKQAIAPHRAIGGENLPNSGPAQGLHTGRTT